MENQVEMCAALCINGCIKHKLVPDSGVTNDFFMEHVAPNIKEKFGEANQVTKTLALPILWACFAERDDGSNHSQLVPYYIKNRVIQACTNIRQLPEGVNPVQKVRFFACMHDPLSNRSMNSPYVLVLVGSHTCCTGGGLISD